MQDLGQIRDECIKSLLSEKINVPLTRNACLLIIKLMLADLKRLDRPEFQNLDDIRVDRVIERELISVLERAIQSPIDQYNKHP